MVELQWTDTGDLGPDQPDYIALHGEKRVARVYSHGTVMSGTKWQWFVWWYAVPNSGITDSRREAFLEVERLYNEHLQQAERSPPSEGQGDGQPTGGLERGPRRSPRNPL